MYSFYGGRPGNSFVIVKAFSSIEEMITNFAQGPNYTEVHYDEHVIINTENKNNQHNGEIYRRGYDYANAMGGAVYIGTIVGPAGKAPMLSLTTQEDIEDMKTQDGQDYNHMYNSGSFSIDQGLVPGKEENSTFNDEITWASYCIKDENSSNSTAYIGFTIPYTVFDWSVESVESYEPIQIIRTKKINTSDEVDHPFYENLTLKIPKGVKGNSFTNLRIGDGSAADGGASYEGALLCDQYDYSTNPATKTIKNLGSPNMISNIEMNDNNEIIVTWKNLGSEVTNLGTINQVKQITVDDNNNLLIAYSDPEKMQGQEWINAGHIKTIQGAHCFYQEEEPEDDGESLGDLWFIPSKHQIKIYIDNSWKEIIQGKTGRIDESTVLSNQLYIGDYAKIYSTDNNDNIKFEITPEKISLNNEIQIQKNANIKVVDPTYPDIINIQLSSENGLWARKGTLGGWTIEENKIFTTFNDTVDNITREARTEFDSQTGSIYMSSLARLKETKIEMGDIQCKDLSNGNYSKILPNKIELEQSTNNHKTILDFQDLKIIDSNNPALADGIVHWKILASRRQVRDSLYVTIYHCGNLFWAHFDFEEGMIPAGWSGILNSFIPIIPRDTQLQTSEKYAPQQNIIKYVHPLSPYNLRLSLTVRQSGDLGISRVIRPLAPSSATVTDGIVNFTYNDTTFSDYAEPADFFWARVSP